MLVVILILIEATCIIFDKSYFRKSLKIFESNSNDASLK